MTVVAEMLESLDIKGAMISADALNTQKDIATKIIYDKANYTLSLKGNHPLLNEAVERLFQNNQTRQKRLH
ncbi:MAG: transposase [Oligoflexia bacterium]|nr:transposase [Oligoflexia bacterium]